MRLLLDTHILIWVSLTPERLSTAFLAEMQAPTTLPMFSIASLWEVAIKAGLRRHDFGVDAALLRRGLLDNGFDELPIAAEHAFAVRDLPPLHSDPFDRMLVAQARCEGVTLVTRNPDVARYPGPIRLV